MPAHDLLPHQSGRSSPWLAASAAPAELPLPPPSWDLGPQYQLLCRPPETQSFVQWEKMQIPEPCEFQSVPSLLHLPPDFLPYCHPCPPHGQPSANSYHKSFLPYHSQCWFPESPVTPSAQFEPFLFGGSFSYKLSAFMTDIYNHPLH